MSLAKYQISNLVNDSERLIAALTSDRKEFKAILHSIAKARVIEIRSKQDCYHWLDKANFLTKNLCNSLASQISLPILLQAVVNFYYGNNRSTYADHPDTFWIGPALKGTIAYISGNILSSDHIGQRTSLKNLKEIIFSVEFILQLNQIQTLFEVFEQPGDYVILGENGIKETSENFADVRRQYWESFIHRGQTHRTLDICNKALWQDAVESMNAVERILAGNSPKQEKIFQGTFFAEIPAENYSAFWAGIWIRLLAAAYSSKFQIQLNQDPLGVSIFNAFPFPIDNRIVRNNRYLVIQEELKKLIWNAEWYEKRFASNIPNMLVERPVVQLFPQREVYATSFLLIGDSINWFVESCILNEHNEFNINVPNHLFQNHVSSAFETAIIQLFRSNGFIAGRVTEQGVWSTESNNIKFYNRFGNRIPGEIDVLAFNREAKLVYILECKVLNYPFRTNQMRNLVYKIDDICDTELFHSKLRKKLSWIKDTNYFESNEEMNFRSFLVLDRKFPGMGNSTDSNTIEQSQLNQIIK
jgi:hypothetical protein